MAINWGDVRWYDPLTASFGGGTYAARRGMEGYNDVTDKSQDWTPWNEQEQKVRQVLAQRPQYQTAYGPEYLKGEQDYIEQLRLQGVDDVASQNTPWAAMDTMQMTTGMGRGEAQRLAAGSAQQGNIARQQLGRDIAGEQIGARQRDYQLRSQDIANKNAYDLSAWNTMAQTEAGLAQGKQQFGMSAPKKGFLANMFS